MIRFEVEGEPVPKARHRWASRDGRVVSYTPARTRDAEEVIGWAFRQAMPGQAPLTGWVGLRCIFYTALNDDVRADVDNLIKTVKDALNGLAYLDDVQVDDVHGKRIRAAMQPRTVIEIWRVMD